jgi:hypothetical protein
MRCLDARLQGALSETEKSFANEEKSQECRSLQTGGLGYAEVHLAKVVAIA